MAPRTLPATLPTTAARADLFVVVSDDLGEVVSNRREAEIFDSSLGDDHDVDGPGEERRLRAIGLANPTLDAVSVNGAADLARHRDAQSTASCRARADIDNELSPPEAATSILHSEKVPPLPEPRLLGEAIADLGGAGAQSRYFLGTDTAKTLRPRRRRVAMVLRPAAVAIRARNPCLFKRLRLLG